MVRFFLDRGATWKPPKEMVPKLFWAAHGHAATVALLAGAGADVRKREFVEGAEPIHFAVQQKLPSQSNSSSGSARNTRLVLQHLLTFGAAPGARTGIVGPRNGDGTFKKDPEREEMQGGRTPLMLAAHGNLPAMEVLLGLLGSTDSNGSGGKSSREKSRLTKVW